MAVLKEVKSLGEVIFVDAGEKDRVPGAVRGSFSGSYPIVVVTDNKAENVFGTYDHSQLKTFDFNRIFKDAKKQLRDLKAGTTTPTTAETPGKTETPAAAPATRPAPATGSGKFADTPFEEWVSDKGTVVEARLEDVSGDNITLRSRTGRLMKLKRAQLSVESARKLEEYEGK